MGQIRTIAVLGLGPSLALYDGAEDFAIGVNDIWARVEADYVVCLDLPEKFEPARLAVINGCAPSRFYTQLTEWASRTDYHAIQLQPQYPDYICQLDPAALPMSHCSPFVAAAIAWKLHGAQAIHVYGVDLVNHQLLSASSLRRIHRHFGTLKSALAAKGCTLKVHGDGLLRSL